MCDIIEMAAVQPRNTSTIKNGTLNFAFYTVRRTSNNISGEPLKNTAVDKILDPFSAERG